MLRRLCHASWGPVGQIGLAARVARFARVATLARAALTVALVAGTASAAGAATELLKEEPARASVRRGQIVYVDDGTCPAGEVKKITGGNQQAGVARQVACVKRAEALQERPETPDADTPAPRTPRT